jgi:GAF domain-containing protein
MKLPVSILAALAVLFAGVIVLSLVYITQENTIATYNNSLPYISLGDNIKNKTTKGHLWFEEYLAGDATIDVKRDVLDLFNSSKETLEAAVNGEKTDVGTFSKDQDEEILRALRRSVLEMDKLIEVANKRIQNKQAREKVDADSTLKVIKTGEEAGGNLDQDFDQAYENVQMALDKLIEYVNADVNEKVKTINFTARITVIVLILIFLSLSFLIFRIQRSNEKSAKANKERLVKETVRIEKMTDLVQNIAKGNYDISLDLNLEEDELATTLVEMQAQLQKATEEDKRRNWANEGFAQISQILRTDVADLKDWYFQLLTFVVDYTHANQGGLFVIQQNENEKFIDLKSCVAFDRKRFHEKRLEMGEGLIGRCILEEKSIYMLDIPTDYLKITSGLGDAPPRNLLLMPMRNNGEVMGVLELATFTPFEPYKVEFIEKISESIANTLISVKVNEQTRALLKHTQEQAEQLRAAEEEMRQNMEELAATQEEMRRRENDYLTQIKDLKAVK